MSKGWTKFPNHLIDQLADFKETELKVLIFLLRSLNQNRCYLPQRRISAVIKKGRIAVNRAIQSLKKKGIIQDEHYPGRISLYRITPTPSPEKDKMPITVPEALAVREKNPYSYKRGEAVRDFALCPYCQFSAPIINFTYVAHSRNGKKEFLLCQNCQKIFWIFTER